MPVPPFQTIPASAFNPIYVKGRQNQTYFTDSGNVPIPAAEIAFAWIRNDHATKHMVYWNSSTSYNGGDVSGTKTVVFRGRFGIAEPTAGFVEQPLIPLNGSNPHPAPGTARFATGLAGMTVADLGIVAATVNLQKGLWFGPDPYGIVIPPGGNVGCSMEAAEVGLGTDLFFFSWEINFNI